MKTILLTLILSIGNYAQCTTNGPQIGEAFWDVSPFQTQIHGEAGSGANRNIFIMQGFSGVMYMLAPDIQLHGYIELDGTVRLNGKVITLGPVDSGGKGYRALVVPN